MAAKSLLDALTNFDASAVIAKALAASGPKVIQLAAGQARKTPDLISNALGLGFAHHLQTTFDRCYKIKTLIYRDEPVPLLSQYVSINLGLKNKKITDNTVIKRLEDFQNIIVQGSGGSGKTMFMKYLALCRFERPNGRIPLFVEMRSLDYSSGKPIERLIYEYTTSKRSKITFDQFEASLAKGIFLVILDGLDEVDPDSRPAVHRQILEFPTRYPDNILVISSREDSSLVGWGPFYVFNVLPLDKKQVTAVIKKIDFDSVIKVKFLKELAADLYEKHQSFLTNPLLATIMLLRYDQFANSSNKIYIFYEQAFETLFFKHDLSKGVYERKRYTKLTVDEFARFFAAFSFSSYAKNKYIFSRSEIVERIAKALAYTKLEAVAANVIRDLVESICIMQQDGLNYSFVHRSFQEYFAALFVVDYRGPKLHEYVEAIMNRGTTEYSGLLLNEMSPELVEREWTMPLLEKLTEALSANDLYNDTAESLNLICGNLWLDKDGSARGFSIGRLGADLLSLNRLRSQSFVTWLRSNLLFDSREDLDRLYSKFHGDERSYLIDKMHRLSGTMDRRMEEKDNFWLVETNAVEIIKSLRESLIKERQALREKLISRDVADDELI